MFGFIKSLFSGAPASSKTPVRCEYKICTGGKMLWRVDSPDVVIGDVTDPEKWLYLCTLYDRRFDIDTIENEIEKRLVLYKGDHAGPEKPVMRTSIRVVANDGRENSYGVSIYSTVLELDMESFFETAGRRLAHGLSSRAYRDFRSCDTDYVVVTIDQLTEEEANGIA